MTARSRLAAAAVFLAAAAGAATAPPAAPCTGPEWTQLDFWVGEWDVSWPASPGAAAGSGTNRIEKILDGCVVSENFSGGGPQALVGRSWSTFDAKSGKWRQTWVDNQGSYLPFTGDFSNPDEKIFAMRTTGKDGRPVELRMVFKNIAADAFDWSWERSSDGGKTWRVQWPIHYARRRP